MVYSEGPFLECMVNFRMACKLVFHVHAVSAPLYFHVEAWSRDLVMAPVAATTSPPCTLT
jgi:hypothetical protein